MTIGKIGCVGHDCLDCHNNQIELTQLRALNAELKTENDQLRHAMDGLTQRCVDDTALIGELVEALNQCGEAITWQLSGEPLDTLLNAARDAARAALEKAGAGK